MAAFSRMAAPVAFFLCFLLIGTAAASQDPLCLVVEAETGGPAFLCLPVSAGQEFHIEFLHSYDRFPFQEYYRIQDPDRILLFSMVFRSVLNGQGFVYAGARVRPDGWGEIRDISEVHDRVEFIMGSREHADHRLVMEGKTHILSDIIEPGTVVVIRVQDISCHDLAAK